MLNSTRYAAAAICTILFSAAASEAALAKSCSAAKPSSSAYWSWRLIDGRKCWYEGKPGLSKSSLEWPTHEAAHHAAAHHEATPKRAKKDPPRDPVEAQATPGNLLDAQANAVEEPDSFAARWQARIGGQQ